MDILPAELLTRIFDLASDEDILFQYGLPTNMAECAWVKNYFGHWTLRPPQEALNLIQRRSYWTKKAIILTCKRWRQLGSEFLFRCLFFNDPSKLYTLSSLLESSSMHASTASFTLGWWTRRIHITRYYASASKGTTMADMENALIKIIQYCPNIEIFIVDWPMKATFGPVADTLAGLQGLRTVHWNVPVEDTGKVIWALDLLPGVIVAHIEFEGERESVAEELGAAAEVQLKLRCLQQLSLRGNIQEFVDQASGWSIPALMSVTFDCGSSRTDIPDVVSFLKVHGSQLIHFDLFSIPPLDVPTILGVCPMLETFCFNADWRLPFTDMGDSNPLTTLVKVPHPCIRTIGLHGLMNAFVDNGNVSWPLHSQLVAQSNDLNVAGINKRAFPRLERVRALNRTMLQLLSEDDGPSVEGGGLERWERWWEVYWSMGVRLEDCTGDQLGTLPMNDAREDEDEDGDEDEDDEDEDEEYTSNEEEEDDYRGGKHSEELRQLVEECKAMTLGREGPMFSMLTMNDDEGPL